MQAMTCFCAPRFLPPSLPPSLPLLSVCLSVALSSAPPPVLHSLSQPPASLSFRPRYTHTGRKDDAPSRACRNDGLSASPPCWISRFYIQTHTHTHTHVFDVIFTYLIYTHTRHTFKHTHRCVWEGESESEWERESQRERERESQRERVRETESERDWDVNTTTDICVDEYMCAESLKAYFPRTLLVLSVSFTRNIFKQYS